MRYALPTLALIAVIGWEGTRPNLRKGTWRPTGDTDLNLEAQIIRPSDLVCGVGCAPVDSTMPTSAVTRNRARKIQMLPDSSLVLIPTQSSGGNRSVTATVNIGGPELVL